MKRCCCWKSRLFILVFSACSLLWSYQNAFAGQGKVTGISGRTIEINLGRANGLNEGSQLKVVRNVEIKRGDTVLKTEQLVIGEVEIVTLEENSAAVKMLRSYRPIQAEDTVLAPSEAPKTVVKAGKKPAAPKVEEKPKQVAKAEAKPKAAPVSEPPVLKEDKITPKPELKPEPVVAPPAESQKEEEKETKEEAEVEAQPALAVTGNLPESAAKLQVRVNGELAVTSDPADAELYLDGKHLGTTPKTLFDLEAKKYQIKLVKDQYYPWSGEAQIVAGQTRKLDVDLKRFEGSLQVNSMPSEAEIISDGSPLGMTNAQVWLKPGEHSLLVKKTGYKTLEKQVNLTAGKPQTLNLVLERVGVAEIADMIFIPKGEFGMGSANGLLPHESPKHAVSLEGFYIDKHEVSNAQYAGFMKATRRNPPAFWHDNDLNKPDQPVVGVSWNDAMAYAKWTGKRLPTEAEWEKAARGFDGRIYPWGHDKSRELANGAGKADGYLFTAPVSSLAAGASPYGVLNLAGNVWEWCADWYGKNYYADSPSENPPGPASGKLKVLRGGAWDSGDDSLRTTNRYAEPPDFWGNNVGFRCAK
ncbi:MAG: SUMF1/EgtB/PvdO family nonheme iron enzyme [Candidatus Schekmanbacteria bacterium]|nr:SUMF1/EgtB/PvdO family nonheme iron enzyme [Candidatus Schekmanbacteria bacterium]